MSAVPARRTSRALLLLAVAAFLGAAVPAAASDHRPSTHVTTAASGAAQSASKDAIPVAATALVEQMSTAERAAAVVMGHVPSTDPAALRAYMASGLGGFLLMGSNIPASEGTLQNLTSALTVDSALPPLIAVDQEGGIVSRLPWDDYAASRTLKNAPVADTSAAFTGRGALVARAGITVDFGTVADVTADRSSFIFGRALGADPKSAADRVAAATTAQEPFVASTLKHFPGHGAAPGDSHHSIPTTGISRAQWQATDAVPFVAGVDAGASLLMFGHLSYTAVDPAPASLSAEWHRIAREELGFEGVMVTDDLGMLESSGIPAYSDPAANAVAAIVAGNDLVLTVAGSTAQTAPRIVAGIAAAAEAGTIPAERLQDAAERVVSLRLRIAASSAKWAPCADCEAAG